MTSFFIPKIIYGKGAIKTLEQLSGSRAIIVSDSEKAASMAVSRIHKSSMDTRVYIVNGGCAFPEPVIEGAKAMMEFKPDWVAAIGQHGALDCAKLISLLYQRPELSIDDLAALPKDLSLKRIRLIALPLLNSDSSEVSPCAALALPSGGECPVIREELIPQLVIIDPSVLDCCSQESDALTAFSAMTLSIETAASGDAGCFIRPFAMEGFRMCAEGISPFSGLQASREKLLYGQCLSGIARSSSAPGLCSAMARASSGHFISRSFGQLSAIYLPRIIRLSESKETDSYGQAAKALGLKDGRALSDMLQEYAEILGLRLTLRELGLEKNVFLKKLSPVAQHAANYPGLSSPFPVDTQKDIEDIFRSAYSE